MRVILTKDIETKLGTMVGGITENKLCLLEFKDPNRLSRTLSKLEKTYKYTLIDGEHDLFKMVVKELNSYYDGDLKQFSLPLLMIGTEFEKNVWDKLLTIPYGQTKSYLEIAKSINNPTGFRAVARANGSNNISIIIPCHRVIASNGNLQGYGGGLWRKELLLNLERNGIMINQKLIDKTKNKQHLKLLKNWI